jgi:hypothetical protein
MAKYAPINQNGAKRKRSALLMQTALISQSRRLLRLLHVDPVIEMLARSCVEVLKIE